MEPAQFAKALQLGLGRAILWLQEHDAAPYRDAILECCLHNTAYDPQVEGIRVDYLLEVMALTGDRPWFEQRVLDALREPPGDAEPAYEVVWDIYQLCELALEFARGGDEAARVALYQRFEAHAQTGYDLGAIQIISLDGLQGFLHVAAKLGGHPNKHSFTGVLSPADVAARKVGEEAFATAIGEARRSDATIAAYVDWAIGAALWPVSDRPSAPAVGATAEPKRVRTGGPLDSLTYAELRDGIVSGRSDFTYMNLRRWAKAAGTEALLAAALGLESERDPDRLLCYLYIFTQRAYPLELSTILNLARHDQTEVTWRAGQALEMFEHPDVRQLALDYLTSPERGSWAVDLLVRNYAVGDAPLIRQGLRAQRDQWHQHGFGIGVRQLFETHREPELVPTLLDLYELGPCSFCRQHVLELLHEFGALPDWMLREAVFDSYDETREWARALPHLPSSN